MLEIKNDKLKEKLDNWETIACDGCPNHGEPNGCNRENGTCPAYDFIEELVAEIKATPKFRPACVNEPAAMVAEAFEILHPEAKYEAVYAPEVYDENGTAICSLIAFPDEQDGPDAVPTIFLNSQLGVEVTAKEFAQQLIHALLGPDSLAGGEVYDAALNALKAKYKEIGDARFPEPEKPEGGGENG